MASIIGIIVGGTILILLFKPFFGNFKGFSESVVTALTPDLFSFFSGKLLEDWLAEMKITFWLMISTIPGVIVYFIIESL